MPVNRRPAGLSASDALALLRADVESIAIEAARAARLGRVEDAVKAHILGCASRVLAVLRAREASHAV